MIQRILFLFVASFILNAVSYGKANATFISLMGEADFKVEQKDGSLHFTGTYTTVNQGDERATDVFPKLQMGSWAWAGEPQKLDPKESYQWTIDATFSVSDLACKSDSRCAGIDLPMKGIHPVLITRHYRDLNGYEFSAVDLKSVTIGEVDSSKLVLARVPDLNIRMSIDGDGGSFTATAEIQNSGDQDIEAAFSYLTPREFRSISQPQTLTIPAGSIKEASFSFENFKGLIGSSYAIVGLLQWEQGGIRVSQPVSTGARILEKKELPFGYMIIGVLALCLIIFCFYVFRD